MKHSLFASTFLLAGLAAQTPFKASDYLPDDYRLFVQVDLAALRDQDVWDGIEASPLKMILAAMEREAGFKLEALDRVILCAVLPDGETAESQKDSKRVVVFEGNQELDLPDSVVGNPRWTSETIEGQSVRLLADHGEVCFRPRPNVRIEGDLSLLRQPIAGKPHLGMPCADVLSLQSTRKQSLMQYGIDVAHPMMRSQVFDKLPADFQWPEGDAPQYVYGRLHSFEVEAEPHVGLEVVIRHKRDGAGLEATGKALDKAFAMVAANPQMRIVQSLLAAVKRTKDRGDIVLQLDLGRTRDAAGKIAMIAMPMLMIGTTEVRAVQAAQPVPAPATEPATPPATEPDKKK